MKVTGIIGVSYRMVSVNLVCDALAEILCLSSRKIMIKVRFLTVIYRLAAASIRPLSIHIIRVKANVFGNMGSEMKWGQKSL